MTKKDLVFERKKKRALEIMAERGMWKSSYSPPLHHLLWKLGINCPPPTFTFFWTNVFLFAAMYAPGWGVMMWFTAWKGQQTSLSEVLSRTLLAGVLFSFTMALFHFWRKKANKLPEWKQL